MTIENITGKRYFNLSEVPAVVRRAILASVTWSVSFDASPEYTEANGDREPMAILDKADTVSSRTKDSDFPGYRHKYLLLDIDIPSALIDSSTRGHKHLYVELPEEIPTKKLEDFLRAAALIGLVDVGYAEASISRGFTSLRLPWVRKRVFDGEQ